MELKERIVGSDWPVADLPLDLEEALVESFLNDKDRPRVNLEDTEYFGAGVFSVSFSWQPFVEIAFSVPKARLTEVVQTDPEQVDVDWESDLSARVSTARYLVISGSLSIDIGESTLSSRQYAEEDYGALVDRAAVQVASLDVSE